MNNIKLAFKTLTKFQIKNKRNGQIKISNQKKIYKDQMKII